MEKRKLNVPVDPTPVTPAEQELPEISPAEVTVPAPAEQTPAEQPSFLDQQIKTEREWKAAIEKQKAEAAQAQAVEIIPPEKRVSPIEEVESENVEEQNASTSEDEEIAKLEAALAAKKAARAKSAPAPQPKAIEEPKKETVVDTPKPVETAAKPTKPEKDTAAIAETNNASNRVFTEIGSDEELENLIELIDSEDTRSDEAKSESPNQGIIELTLCNQIGQRTKQQRMLNRFIEERADDDKHYTQLTDPMLRLSKINPKVPQNQNGKGPVKLTGEAAKLAVLSRTHGLYRIQLYNSGFWITIRPIQVVDASAFIHEVDADFKELGRIIGGQFHLVLGVYLKHKVLEILPDLIVSSNLEDWDQPEVLGDAISYQDYDTILWGICCAMYRDGIGIGVHCTNPECRNVDNNQYVDLTKACYINPEVFNQEAMMWMLNTRTTRTLQDCINYRTNILKSNQTISVDNNTDMVMTVPSLARYAKLGIELVGKMEAAIYRTKNKKNDELMNQITFHMYKMLAPWISKIIYKGNTGNVSDDVIIDDYDAICTALESEIDTQGTLYDKIEAYIRDTKCSMYCLTSLECPKCHKKPDLNADGLFPLDAEYLFFGLSCLKLEQTGIQL